MPIVAITKMRSATPGVTEIVPLGRRSRARRARADSWSRPAADGEVVIDSASRIEILVPDVDGGYRIVTSTDNGDEEIVVTDDPGASRSIRAETDNGDIRIAPTT